MRSKFEMLHITRRRDATPNTLQLCPSPQSYNNSGEQQSKRHNSNTITANNRQQQTKRYKANSTATATCSQRAKKSLRSKQHSNRNLLPRLTARADRASDNKRALGSAVVLHTRVHSNYRNANDAALWLMTPSTDPPALRSTVRCLLMISWFPFFQEVGSGC